MAWLDDPALIAERRAALGAPHIAPLEIWREGLVGAGHTVPHFDPFDGGIDARLLLLLETPGPGPDRTRFVSRDNPSGTARNLRRYLEAAGIARMDIVQWNCVPWIVHAPGARNRALRRTEIAEGLATLPDLLAKLPGVRVCILAGRVAAGRKRLSKRHGPMCRSSPCPTLVRPMSAPVLMSANGSKARCSPPGTHSSNDLRTRLE
jgi:hypothetical protein